MCHNRSDPSGCERCLEILRDKARCLSVEVELLSISTNEVVDDSHCRPRPPLLEVDAYVRQPIGV